MSLITIIIFGALSSCFAIVFELTALALPLFSDSASSPFAPLHTGNAFTLGVFLTLLGVAVIEEISKYLFLRQYAFRYLKDTLTSVRTTLLLGVLFGAGFAAIELGLAIGSAGTASWLPLIGIALLHILTSLLFAFSLFHRSLRRPLFGLYPILAALVLHMLYNTAVFLLS